MNTNLLRRLLPLALSWTVTIAAQTPAAKLDPALLGKPPIDAWPTYHGDYSGRRYSTLKQIDTTNVKSLTLAWVYRLNTSSANAMTGGEGPDASPAAAANATIKSTPLMVNGVLYLSVPDHVWAIDARTGRDMWHFLWKTRGGDHIGNRGVGMFGEWLYFLTPDNYFVSLDAATGKERWHKEIANMKREYFSTNAPIIVGRQVIIGVGGDAIDLP
ncbi:MAG TPA: PQQ-binding-like beta-propeller repeat protein, partial [Vicinamibacterales bacterium]|nr:PQQ-binding-like beta-propeller repeat protein [Vicinamibacterales bacterium]